MSETENKDQEGELDESADQGARSLSRALQACFGMLKLAMALAAVVFFLNGIFPVNEGDAALKKRFGRYVTDEEGKPVVYKPGWHYAIPVVEQAEHVSMKQRTLSLDREFWPLVAAMEMINSGGGDGKLRPGVDGYLISGDTNILHNRWQLVYKVSDPYLFLTTFQDKETGDFNPQTNAPVLRPGPEQLLREVFATAVVSVTAGTPVDNTLFQNISDYIARIKQRTEDGLRKYNAGIELTSVEMKEKNPPRSTKQAFDEVTNASNAMGTAINNANGKKMQILAIADGKAKEILNEAELYKNKAVSSAAADADVFNNLFAKFGNDRQALATYLRVYHQQFIQDELQEVTLSIISPHQTWVMIGAMPPTNEKEEKKQ